MTPVERGKMVLFSDPSRIVRLSVKQPTDRMDMQGQRRNVYQIARISVALLMSSVLLELYPGYREMKCAKFDVKISQHGVVV